MEDPEVDRLYALPLEEFTQARDALAARLRTAGDAKEAARVKTLKKPTAPAWAVNQLARRNREQVEILIAASERLRRAQHELLDGGPAGDLWEATLSEREAAGALVDAAEKILGEAGYGATRAALDRVADTLYAAAADPAGQTLLRRGLITQEMRRAGFGDVIAAPPSARSPASPAPSKPHLRAVPSKAQRKPEPAAKRRAGPTARELFDAEREAEKLNRAAASAQSDADRLTREADRTAEEAASARKRADAAARTAAEARAEASDARKAAAEARRTADRAAARLERLRSKG